MAVGVIDSVVMIEELTGAKRKLELYGSGMPRKGAPWAGSLKKSKTNNMGNADRATLQVLGPAEDPSSWAGRWATTMLLATPAQFIDEGGKTPENIVRAKTLADILEGIFRAGQRLRVTWVQTDSSKPRRIVREGVAENWVFAVDTADDVEWSISWDWVSRGPQAAQVDKGGDKTLASLREANRVLTQYTTEVAIRDELQSKGGDVFPNSFSLSDLEAIANIPKEFAKQLQQFSTLLTTKIGKYASLIVSAAATPVQFATSMTNIATNAITTLNQTIDSMGAVMPDALSDLDGSAAALVNAADYYSVSQDGAENIVGSMAQILANVQQRRSGIKASATGDQAISVDILAVVISRSTDTFYSLSMRYYGTADLSSSIAIANGFDEAEFAPPTGTTLVIPNINPVLLPLKV